MPIEVCRPGSTIQNGNWTVTGAGGDLDAALSDDLDTTYISSTAKSDSDATFAIFDFADVFLPSGSKIKQVTLRLRTFQTAPTSGGSFPLLSELVRFYIELAEELVDDIFDGGLGDGLSSFFRHLFGFPNPTPPSGGSATWTTSVLKAYPEKPSGGEWDIDTFNALTWKIGRTDTSGALVKISEYYVDLEYNEQPVVTLTGPTEVRQVTDGVTTNADQTVTSATAAFTSDDIGAAIAGTGIPVGATIASINSATSVEISANATSSGSGRTLTITRTVITATTRPPITFAYTDPENDPKAGHRVKVFDAATAAAVGFDVETSVPITQTLNSLGQPDWITGTGLTWVCNKDLENGDYVVFVQVRQKWEGIGEHRSEWASWEFTQHVTGPDTPIVTATANNVTNWVQLEATPDGDNVPATETITFYYSDNFGVTWHVVRDGWQVQADENGYATFNDYEAPLKRERWYKAKGYRTLSGVKVASDESNIATATPGAPGWWIKDLAASSLNMRIVVLDDVQSIERVQGLFPVLTKDDGSQIAYKRVVNGPVSGIDGQMVVLFKGDDDTSGWDQFLALYRPGRDLLLQSPTGKNIYLQLGKKISVPWKPRGNHVYYRTPGFTYTEVQRPPDPTVPPSAAT